jgi:hypothetical protein
MSEGQCGLMCFHNGSNGEGMDHGAVRWKGILLSMLHIPTVRHTGLWPFPLDSTMLPTLYHYFHWETYISVCILILKMATAVHAKMEQFQHTAWRNSGCQNYLRI